MGMKIGIITFHSSYNFGSALQAQALIKTLQGLGHDPTIIDYRSRDFDQYLLLTPRHPRQSLKVLKRLPRYLRRKKAFERFMERYLQLTDRRYTYENESALDELQDQFDCFICGSDQIWNLDATHGVVEPFFLSFAGDTRRVAYAPSLAHMSFRPEYFDKEKVSELLGRFEAISVREGETVGLFQPLVAKKIQVTLDPTMLLDASDYTPMTSAEPCEGRPYVFVYLLRDCPELVASASVLAGRGGTRVLYVSDDDLPIPNSQNLLGIGPEEFVSLVAHAEAVLTNSFHATVFSLKFHRPFRTFANDKSSSRMRDLLGELGVEVCLTTDVDVSPLARPDWDDVDRRVATLRQGSLRFLREALS